MTWEFRANTREELAKVRDSLPERASPTVAGELAQMRHLLEALAETDVLAFPFRARHTGDKSVPDFQLESGSRRIGVEMAKVTTANLEHARALQMKMPDPPFHFAPTNLCDAESFARALKAGRNKWSSFVAARLSDDCRLWLKNWNGHDKVPDTVKEHFVAVLNSIIDGPPIGGDPALEGANPRPETFEVEGFPGGETPRQRKSWLEDAFWEHLAVPLNPTLMVTPFIRQQDDKMTRDEVLTTGFILPAMPIGGPTIQEEHEIWIERVASEVQDKSAKLANDTFLHGDEDWLVLWDLLGTADWQLAERAEAVAQLLAPMWKAGWFSRVVIQAEYFQWQLMLTAEGARVLNG